jgi:hypothetical protein
MRFLKTKDREIKQVLYGSRYQWEGGRHKERMEGEYGGNMYSCTKMEKRDLVETILRNCRGD